MNIIYPLTNKSTLAAFSYTEEKTLRDLLFETLPSHQHNDEDAIMRLTGMLQWHNLSILMGVDMGYDGETLDVFQDYLEFLAYPIYNTYADYHVAYQEVDDFKRHLQGWLEKKAFKWVPAFLSMTQRVKFNENASEKETFSENVKRAGKNEQTTTDTLERTGTNTSTAALSSNSTAKKLSSNFPIIDHSGVEPSLDEVYADGSEQTTQESTSNATNNATAEANETRNGTNSGNSNGTEDRTYTLAKDTTNGRTPFELQRAYLDSLTNLTDEIVCSFATLLNGNMYAF